MFRVESNLEVDHTQVLHLTIKHDNEDVTSVWTLSAWAASFFRSYLFRLFIGSHSNFSTREVRYSWHCWDCWSCLRTMGDIRHAIATGWKLQVSCICSNPPGHAKQSWNPNVCRHPFWCFENNSAPRPDSDTLLEQICSFKSPRPS